MDNSKQILLISYTFPPSAGIGGRRWAKFAKYLSRLGYYVHVIYAPINTADKSLWIDDIIDNENIKLYPVKSSYPSILLLKPETIFQKINYRISLSLIKLTSKGTPYDRAWLWNKSMLRKAEYIIDFYKIKNVAVSCAPFSCAYYSLELKKKYNDLNLLVDFRDPWTWGQGYGFNNLSAKRLNYEKMMEGAVVKFSDKFFVPSIEMKKHLVVNYPAFEDKIFQLPHGFDEDEIIPQQKNYSKKLRLVLYGTLYNNLGPIFENLANFINNTNHKISLDIYSTTFTYKNTFKANQLLGNDVNYYKPISPKLLFKKFNEYDYALIIQPDFAKDFITTKIYEIIYSATPILLIANEGELSKFICNNNLGLFYTPNNLSKNLNSIFKYDASAFKLNQFKWEKFSFKLICSIIIKLLK
ncbi:MAG: hypothetical protein K9H41_00470 [Bacteroidia bacterium]|nr:hypothetical protein [Bacteroidia bacterium]